MKKVVCLSLAAALLLGLLAGCGSGTQSSAEVSAQLSAAAPAEETAPDAVEETTEETAETTVSTEESADPLLVKFPIEEDVTVSMFTSVESSIASYVGEDYSQISVLRGWTEATGVKLDVTAAPADAAKELFAVIAASDTVPDIVVQGGAWYPGGATAGVKDEVYANLIDYKEYMPNYLAALEEYGFTSTCMTDDEINAFWQINVNNLPFAGIVARGDMLDNIGMSNTEIKTFDDWTEMLRGLKTQDGIVAPLAMSVIGDMGTGVVLSGGFGISAIYQNGSYINLPLYVVDGQVRFGFLDDNYDKYVDLISGWFAEDLVNDNIMTMEGGPYAEEYVLRGENAVFMAMYGNAGYYEKEIPGAKIVPLYLPVEHEGDVYHFSENAEVSLESGVWNVGFNAENKELIVQMIDWFYTDEGSRLASYGIEGEAYTLDDQGNIQLTELITNNPDGLSAQSAMNIFAGDLIPAKKDASRLLSTYDSSAIEAMDFAMQQETDNAYSLPSGLSSKFTEEEQEIYNTYSPDLLTYMSEHALAFLMGLEDKSQLPAFKQKLIDLGIEDIIDVYQAAYDRVAAES